jgi:hypothetical protein
VAVDPALFQDGPYDNVDRLAGATYSSASFTPAANQPLYVLVALFGTSIAAPTSVSSTTGHGTLTLVPNSEITSGTTRRMAWYAAAGIPSPTSGVISVVPSSNATGCHIVAVQASGVDEQSDFGVLEAAAVAGSSTSGAVTLSVAAGNGTILGACHVGANEDTVAGTGLTEMSDSGGATPTQRTATYEQTTTGVSNPGASWATTGAYMLSALEIRAAAGGVTTTVIYRALLGVGV